jgi:hypothetical protein
MLTLIVITIGLLWFVGGLTHMARRPLATKPRRVSTLSEEKRLAWLERDRLAWFEKERQARASPVYEPGGFSMDD